jgi:hypothetical protein
MSRPFDRSAHRIRRALGRLFQRFPPARMGARAQFERVTMTVTLPPVAEPGRYRVEFDMVLEGVM